MAFSLRATLGMDSGKFQKGIDGARRKVSRAAKGMMTSLAPIAGFLGFSTLAANAVNAAREITNLSKVANTSGETFQKLAFGAKTAGVNQEKLADIFKDASDKIGDFLQNEAGPLKDFFDNIAPQVGVTAEQFRNLSGPDALQLYYNSIEKANLSQSEMTFFMEAIASDAALLTPLLEDNGKAFKTLGEQAENAGLIMSDLEREKMNKVSLQLDVMKKRATILTGTFLTRFIPAVKILGDGLGFVADVIGAVAAIGVQWGMSFGRVISAVIKPAIKNIEALGLSLKAAGQAMARDFDGAKESIRGAKDAVSESVEAVKDIPSEMAKAAQGVATTVESAWETLGDSVGNRSKAIMDNLDDVKGKGEETADALANALTGGTAGTEGGDGGGGGTGGGNPKLSKEQLRIQKLKLEALKAQVRGEIQLSDALNRRVELAQRILQIEKETGATRREAVIIANKEMEAVKKKASAAKQGGIQTGKIGSAGQIGSGPSAEFLQRERDAGLFNTTLGRTDPAALSEQRSETPDSAPEKLDKLAKILETIEKEMTAEAGAAKE